MPYIRHSVEQPLQPRTAFRAASLVAWFIKLSMSEEEIAQLTVDVNRFAIQQGWLPSKDTESAATRWRNLRLSRPRHHVAPATSNSHEMLQIWEDCMAILNGLLQHRNAYVFSRPVDPLRDGVPNYFEVIKRPMDLGTVKQKLALTVRRRSEPMTALMYRRPEEFKADVELVWANCFLYNPPEFEVHGMGLALKAEFERRWKAMRIEDRLDKTIKKQPHNDDEHSIQLRNNMDKVLKKRKPVTQQNSGILNKTKATKKDRISHAHAHHHKKQAERQLTRNVSPIKEIQQEVRPGRVGVDNRVRKKSVEVNQLRKANAPTQRANKTSQGQKMMKLLHARKKPCVKTESAEEIARQPPREWKPPIERGGNTSIPVISRKPKGDPHPHQPLQRSEVSSMPNTKPWKKCNTLYCHITKSLERTRHKSEDQMTDYEARRLLSALFEDMSVKALDHILSNVISKDPFFRNSASGSIEQLDIKTVRKVVKAALNAARRKKRQSPEAEDAAPSSTTLPAAMPPPNQTQKRKKPEDDGYRLATKTPMVSPPSPPWHRRLTHKREVWDNAVGLYGITPRQDASVLGLTQRQESNSSGWEEAVPDDVEDGEILD